MLLSLNARSDYNFQEKGHLYENSTKACFHSKKCSDILVKLYVHILSLSEYSERKGISVEV